MRNRPSDEFIAAVETGYRRAKQQHGTVTPSEIWDEVVGICLSRPGGFRAMFAWDRRTGRQNRVGTIAECIEGGYVPGLRMAGRNVEEA